MTKGRLLIILSIVMLILLSVWAVLAFTNQSHKPVSISSSGVEKILGYYNENVYYLTSGTIVRAHTNNKDIEIIQKNVSKASFDDINGRLFFSINENKKIIGTTLNLNDNGKSSKEGLRETLFGKDKSDDILIYVDIKDQKTNQRVNSIETNDGTNITRFSADEYIFRTEDYLIITGSNETGDNSKTYIDIYQISSGKKFATRQLPGRIAAYMTGVWSNKILYTNDSLSVFSYDISTQKITNFGSTNLNNVVKINDADIEIVQIEDKNIFLTTLPGSSKKIYSGLNKATFTSSSYIDNGRKKLFYTDTNNGLYMVTL